MSIDAMKQALEALELLARYENPATRVQVRKPRDGGPIVTMYPHKIASEAAVALRAAIEQAKEPVAWISHSQNLLSWDKFYDDMTPLYTAPRQWQGLTGDEIWACNVAPAGHHVECHICVAHQNVLDFAEAIEAKLREKNS